MKAHIVPCSLLLACLPALDAGAAIEIEKRLDLAKVLGAPAADVEVAGLAFDGKDLWLVTLSSRGLLRIDVREERLAGSYPFPVTGKVRPAGLAFGAGSLWMGEAESRGLVRFGLDGAFQGFTSLGSIAGEVLGVDFRTGEAVDRVVVLCRDPQTGAAGQVPFLVQGTQLVPAQPRALPVRGAASMASTLIDGSLYTWVSAPRKDGERLEGDEAEEGGPVSLDEIRSAVPDDSIPRGGEDSASTHSLALVDTLRNRVLFRVTPQGPPVRDLAAAGDTIFYPDGGAIDVAVWRDPFAVEYGACVCRDMEFHLKSTFDDPADSDFCFAYPYDMIVPPDVREDQTAGYLAQTFVDFLDESPESILQTVSMDAGARIGVDMRREGRTFFSGGALLSGTREAWYRVRMELCDASYNLLPAKVGALADIPAEILERYTYEAPGDGDAFGDDNPDTDRDDYFKLDTALVHRHAAASGALEEPSLYWKARKIHDYVKRRHVYSGDDPDGWADPSVKLESPYATCSESAFMVVALAREAGLAARLVGTTKQRGSLVRPGDVARDTAFHRWAQIYFPNYGWVRIDATPAGPASVGYLDLNRDGKYDVSDRRGANDADSDGDVDGDDIEITGAAYYDEEYLAGSFNRGVGTDDLVTIVSPGIPDDLLGQHYVSNIRGPDGRDLDRWVDWTNPYGLLNVVVRISGEEGEEKGNISWQTSGPYDSSELVRIDLYRLEGTEAEPHYRHVRLLAGGVPALAQAHVVDLAGAPLDGSHGVVVTRQGALMKGRLTGRQAADWETFGLARLLPFVPVPEFIRGDADASGFHELTDAVFVLNWLFVGGREPPCLDAADANDSEAIDIADAVFILSYLFLGGPAPPPPFPLCGPDPFGAALDCDSFPPCD